MNPYEYVDLHCHILPGIDDGARDMAQSQRMLRMAAADGIRTIIATPHHKAHRRSADTGTVRQLVNELQSWLDEEKIPIKLYTGNEILYRHETDNLLEAKQVCTLADSFYVLIEFSPKDDYAYIKHGVQEVLMAGYYPVVAHIERYDALASHIEHIEELVDLGAYMQVNASSVEGQHGFWEKRKILRWMKEGLVHFVATDAHDEEDRIPQISKSAQVVTKKCGEDVAHRIYVEHPQYILHNKLI